MTTPATSPPSFGFPGASDEDGSPQAAAALMEGQGATLEPQVAVDFQGPVVAAVDGDRGSGVDGGGPPHENAGAQQRLLGLAGREDVAGSWKLEGALSGERG